MEDKLSLVISLLTLVGVLGAAYITKRLPASRPDVIQSQGKSLADAFDEIRELRIELRTANDEIDKLKTENRKFRNGLARAISFIHEKNPLEEIPDFLKESEPKIKAVK